MPVLSMFYGIIVLMYHFDTKRHNLPHIHIKYAEFECVIAIEDSIILEGTIPKNKMKLVDAWMELHREELLANWKLAVNGEQIFKIDPLK